MQILEGQKVPKLVNRTAPLILPNQKVILNIGAGAAIEKDQESAVNWIESRIKEFEIALQETSAQKQQVIANLESGKQQMNQLMQQAGQKQK